MITDSKDFEGLGNISALPGLNNNRGCELFRSLKKMGASKRCC